MIHIPQHKPLNKENVLALIDEGSLFNYYLPNLVVGKAMLSPFRKEDNPSFLVTIKDGSWHYKDLADSSYVGDVFHYIMQVHNISFPEALKLINRDFGLGFSGEPQKDYKRIIKSLPVQKEKKASVVEEIIRPFTEKDMAWWGKRLQTIEDLEREDIVSMEKAFINERELLHEPSELAFCYRFKDINKKKLYFPERTNKSGKWYGSVPAGYVEGLEYIKDAQKVIILGSKKDRMVAMKFYPYCCNTQNESNIAFTPDFVELLFGKEVYLFYDGDETGRKQSALLCSQFGYKPLFVPAETQTKDIDELVVKHGIYPATELFFKHKLY